MTTATVHMPECSPADTEITRDANGRIAVQVNRVRHPKSTRYITPAYYYAQVRVAGGEWTTLAMCVDIDALAAWIEARFGRDNVAGHGITRFGWAVAEFSPLAAATPA